METELDFIVENHGSLYLIRPQNHIARAFLMAHVENQTQWIGGAVGVAPAYLDELMTGLQIEGFEIQSCDRRML